MMTLEETQSGNRTITSVATSITAFMGRAVMGPVANGDPGNPDTAPMTVFSFADYVRYFGGLSHAAPMSYAVQDFFLNGGSQAVIARLVAWNPGSPPTVRPTPTAVAATLNLLPTQVLSPPAPPDFPIPPPASGGITLVAANPGAWANGNLFALVDRNGLVTWPSGSTPVSGNPTYTDAATTTAAQYAGAAGDVRASDLFNLTLYCRMPSGTLAAERYLNVALVGAQNPNRLDRVLAAQSMLARAQTALPSATPDGWLDAWDDFGREPSVQKADQATLLTYLPAAGVAAQGALAGRDGDPLRADDYVNAFNGESGPPVLDKVDIFNLLCVPPDSVEVPSNIDSNVWANAAAYCVRRRAMVIVDSPVEWTNHARQGNIGPSYQDPTSLGIEGPNARNAAVYFPRVVEADPLTKGTPTSFAPCGIIAGVMATTDMARGVWKAPAGIDAALNGILQLEYTMTDPQNGLLNPLGVNCLRSFPVVGPVVWGARTLRGADQLEDDYKYINVRRLTLYIEESLYRGTEWAVFEPNDQVLWTALTQSADTFLADLQRQGAFYSYFVQCDATTTTPSDIDQGIVNILIGIAPVKPAEFVVIQIQQLAGQTGS
jgi:phage tail sheath protein FI